MRTTALLLAQDMGQDETRYSDCPACGGRRKLSVTRTREGVLWNCFRASCTGQAGVSIVQGELLPPKRRKPRLKPYTRPLLPLEIQDIQYFDRRFCIDAAAVSQFGIQLTEDNRYSIPVRDPRGYERGHMIRNPVWKGDTKPVRMSDWDGPKAVLYMHTQGPTLSWYTSGVSNNPLVLVEDQMSAMSAYCADVDACALLGVSLDHDKVREIAMQDPSEVILALDADATEDAFKLARKYGLAFRKTRVCVLERDLKDEEDIRYALGL